MQPILDKLQQLQQKNQQAEKIDSYRVFHGRGQCFPGLEFICIDFFHPILLITCYSAPPEGWLEELMRRAGDYLSPGITGVLLQRRYQQGAPTEILWGQLPDELYAQRGDLRFHLPIAQQQNTGFFLDMEPGRRWLEQQAAGKRVLNLFAYTCAFSVVAVASGAAQVVNVDMSSRALQLGRFNHQLNRLEATASVFLAENILKSWGRIKRRGPYDLVIIDPPSYQPGSFIAAKDYARVVRRLPELMPDGGLVLACLNAPELRLEFLTTVFAEQCPNCQLLQRLEPHADFPDINPDQQLKLLVFEYQPAAHAKC
jgi:23S rRNA (cytosine1962-C5)-methyltransferase